MKKIIFALAAVVALSACSKTEAEYESTREITFTPIAQNITKAMMQGTTFTTDEKFNVWGFYNSTPVEPTSLNDIDTWVSEYLNNYNKDSKVYIDNKTFEYHDNYKFWAGSTPYYWPKVGSLAFAGYHPITTNASYVLDKDNNKMTFASVENSWVNTSSEANDEDLMYFNLTSGYSQNNVVAVFKHALSWLTVNIATTQETLEAKATITVHDVIFTEVAESGTGVVNNQDPIVWTPSTSTEAVETVEADFDLKLAPTTLLQPLFIPQPMAGDIKIRYTVSSPKEEGGFVASFTETKVIPLKSLTGYIPEKNADGSNKTDANGNIIYKSTGHTTWEAAKHYTYNIVISTEEVLIDASVVNWDEVNVPVEIN